MKFALIGQEIPTLLPSLLTDLLFAGRQTAEVAIEERNPAMQAVLRSYAGAIFARAGLGGGVTVSRERSEILTGADCVIYAGDVMAASRFRMDREALSGSEDNAEDDPFSLIDQARVNGGIGGLLHTLRQGEAVLTLCGEMAQYCPGALVITMGQPVARTAAMFIHRGFRTFGLGRSPMKGPNGVEGICRKLGRKPDTVEAETAGLPDFAFLISLRDRATGGDLMDRTDELARRGDLGRLTRRWLRWYGAIAVGDAPAHAEWMAAQEDFVPEANPELGESVEKRKERILHMNTVGSKGASDREGMMAQLVLLGKAPATRPMKLALALLRGEDLEMPAVTRLNRGELPQLSPNAVIESTLTLRAGEIVPHAYELPASLADACMDIDETSRLAAQAASGDRSALRECIELDPAMEGLDRLYVQDVVDRMIEMHNDVILRFADEEDD